LRGNHSPNAFVLAAFEHHLLSERSSAQLTIETYFRQIEQFRRFVGRKRSLLEIQREEVIAFLSHRRYRKIKERSLAVSVSVLRHFYRFLRSVDLAKHDPTKAVGAPQQQKPAPKTVPKSEVEFLLNANESSDETLQHLRNKAMLAVLYECALRASELLDLRASDVNVGVNPAFIYVRGIAQRTRYVELSAETASVLRIYLEKAGIEPAAADQSNHLFVGNGGSRISRQRLWQIIAAASERGTRHLSPAMLRHSRAAELAASGADAETLQRVLGYADIKNAYVYAPPRSGTRGTKGAAQNQGLTKTGADRPGRAKEQYFAFHPRARRRDARG
jgi:integrase/recombinase XerD